MKMKLLALETSTEACSAALYIDGETRERWELSPGGHGRRILAMAHSLLQEADVPLASLDGLTFGRGPGGFTGVRIATAAVQGLALGLDLPVAPVSSLAALAQGAADELPADALLAAIDARMDEVYWGAYRVSDNGLVSAAVEEQVCGPGEVALPPQGRWWGVGSGWSRQGGLLRLRLGPRLAGVDGDRLPRARDVARLGVEEFRAGRAVGVDRVIPVYLRDQVARKPG